LIIVCPHALIHDYMSLCDHHGLKHAYIF